MPNGHEEPQPGAALCSPRQQRRRHGIAKLHGSVDRLTTMPVNGNIDLRALRA